MRARWPDVADQTVRDLRHMFALGEPGDGCRWTRPLVRTVATRDEGVDDLVGTLDAHRQWLDGAGERERHRLARAEAEIEAVALEHVRLRLGDIRGAAGLPELAKRVVASQLDTYRATDELVAAVGTD